MASGSYFVGLNSQPNLFASIYSQKDAAAAARKEKNLEEQNSKYAKDADKFRIDYSKIHPFHAKEAKLAVAKFLNEADALKKQYPHTYANTEEYNNLFFKTTSDLEDLTGSSKVIYDEQKIRMEHPDKFETDSDMMKAINEGNNDAVMNKIGRNRFQYGDIAMEKWNEQEAMKDIIANTAADELLKKDPTGKVITTPVGGGTEDVYMTAVKTLNSPQLEKNTLDMWKNSPAMQRKFKTEQEALNWAKGFAEQGTKEITSAIYHAPANSGSGAAIQQSLTNNGSGHSMDFGITDGTNVTNYRTKAQMRLSLVPTPTVISVGENTFNKEDGKRLSGGKPVNVTVGEIAVVPVWKSGTDTRGKLLGGRVVPEDDLKNPKQRDKYEYKVIYTGKDEKNKGVYGDIAQVESSLFSKESPITDKTAFAKSLEEMKSEAATLNKQSSSKEATYTIKGKKYTLTDLTGMGYNEAQVSQYKD